MKRNYLIMLLIAAFCSTANAQEIDEVSGKTYYYYDNVTKKKVKEIFHHIQEIRIKTDNHGNSTDTLVYIKNGPYTRYHENGNLECSGYYEKEIKHGVWKYYTTKGELIKTEQWNMGNQVAMPKQAKAPTKKKQS